MFNEDNLAAAHLAQIFGSELLRVQNSARTDGGHSPDIVKMDPKQFLVGQTQYSAHQKEHERRITESLQREAEAAYPITETQPQQHAPQSTSVPAQPRVIPGLPRARVPLDDFASVDVWERIAISLERIANVVDKVENKIKKKTIKRSKPKANKPKTSNPILLNETTAQ